MTDLPPPPGAPPPPPPPPGGGGFPPPPPPGGGGFPPPPPGGSGSPTGGWAQPVGGPAPQLANFGQRLGAWLLDGLIWLGISIGIGVLFVVLVVALPKEDEQLCEDINGDLYVYEPLTGGSVAIVAIVGVLVAIAALTFVVYFWWGKLTGERGQTPGKKAVGIRVVGVGTGQPIGMGKGIGRGLFQSLISGLVCYLGYFWMLWDDKNQTWHDKVVDSIVVADN